MKRFIILIIIIIFIFLIFILTRKKYESIDSIKYFSFHYTTGMAYNADVSFEIDCKEKCLASIKPSGVDKEDSTIVELNDETIKEIIDLLNKYNVSSWDGFNKNDKYVLDGNSFSLSIKTRDNKSISASGYMKWPKNYRDVLNGLKKIYERLLRNN